MYLLPFSDPLLQVSIVGCYGEDVVLERYLHSKHISLIEAEDIAYKISTKILANQLLKRWLSNSEQALT